LGKWDRFLAEQFAYFVGRLKESRDGEGTLLDRTTLLFGSSNSRTHNNTNYPIVFAGGRGLGFKHGKYLRFGEGTPFANVHATILNRIGVPVESFADSSGEMTELLA